jgi:hypothetical protein
MYDVILFLHNLFRWIILAMVADMVLLSWWSYFNKAPYTKLHRILSVITMIFLDLQITLGLIFFAGVSPLVQGMFSSAGGFMKNSAMRFFGIEHVILGLAVAAVLHIGNTKAKKTEDDISKHKTYAVFFTIGLLLIIAMIPWPGLPWGRPLFR